MPSPVWRPAAVDRERCARMLGCAPSALAALPVDVVSTGIPWVVVALDGLPAVRTLSPDFGLVAAVAAEEQATGVTVFCRAADDPAGAVHLRGFAPGAGIPEDPGSRSGAAALPRPGGPHR